MNDEETIRALMTNRGMILAFLGSIVGCPETAEDIFQEVAVVALKRKDELSSPELLGPWFRQVARFQALNHLKKKKLTTFDAAVLDAIDAAWDGDKIDIRVDALRNCIDRLPKNLRQVIEMRYSLMNSTQATATTLGIPVQTVYVYVSRAHKLLRECIVSVLNLESPSGGVEPQ